MRPMKDPAPSRLAYRLNRLMLTPRFRVFLRYGLPVLCVASAVAFWASDEDRRQSAADRFVELKRQIEERPEFMVRLMSVERASESVASDIREIVPIEFPVSSFDLDLDQLRKTVEQLDAVAEASVRIRSGGVLEVEVLERVPSVIWRTEAGMTLLDATGHRVAPLQDRAARPDLPLIVGAGANTKVGEALDLLAVAAPIMGRIRALVRMGERRWDIVLDRDQRIMLPETGAITALEKVMALDAAQDLLPRDIAAVDFRNPRRPVLRLTPEAVAAMYETEISLEQDSQQ